MDKEKTLRKLKQEIEEVREKFGVEFAEVVRCRECKHWHEETGWCYHHSHFIKYGEYGEEFCHPWESSEWKMFDADYFCTDGERNSEVHSNGQ